MLLFITYCIIGIFTCMWIYIRLKHKFWTAQPVFHFYDFLYWIKNVGIINKHLPCKNKYTNFAEIQTINYSNVSESQISRFMAFIRLNYLNNGDNIFAPQRNNVLPYFKNNNQPCFWSFYMAPTQYCDSHNNVITDHIIAGCITSRPMQVFIGTAELPVYYVDYLCVDKSKRRQNIAPQLIQTHEYYQSHHNKNISVSIFKREAELTNIIPFTSFTTFCYRADIWKRPPPKLLFLSLENGSGTNIYYCINFIRTFQSSNTIIVMPSMENIIELIQSDNMHIKILFMGKDIVAIYIFKRTCATLDAAGEIVTCICSIKAESITHNQFMIGFHNSACAVISKIDAKIGYLAIENVSDNNLILNGLANRRHIMDIPNAYYFYNFAHEPFKSTKAIMLI
jgi:hypothetical protein